MIIKNFKELSKQVKITKKSQKKVEPQEKANKIPEKIDAKISEAELFKRAMEGVIPLKNTRGRDLLPVKHEVRETQTDSKGLNRYLDNFCRGKIEFEIEFTDEYIQGNVKGLDPRIFRKLKAGTYSPEAHLDLHGLNTEEAYGAIIGFVKKNYLEGKRCVLVIPGRGKNSPLGKSILKENLQYWITRDPLKRVVLAFSTAIPKHGGAGAVYILLRKYKKSRGKIFWERY